MNAVSMLHGLALDKCSGKLCAVRLGSTTSLHYAACHQCDALLQRGSIDAVLSVVQTL